MYKNAVKPNVAFKSGLNKNVRKAVSYLNVRRTEKAFANEFGIDAKFNKNKALAGCFAYTANIFEELTKKFKLPFGAVPPRIRVYKKENLVQPISSNCFCITNTQKVLKNEPSFEIRSVFAQDAKSLHSINRKIESDYDQKLRSSGHFLADAIHEWCHNLHLDFIFKKYGYEGNCIYAKSIYKNPKSSASKGLKVLDEYSQHVYTKRQKEAIRAVLGDYAAEASSKPEVFAEGFTKLIDKSLNKNTLLPVKNPFDGLREFPRDFRTIFEEILKDIC